MANTTRPRIHAIGTKLATGLAELSIKHDSAKQNPVLFTHSVLAFMNNYPAHQWDLSIANEGGYLVLTATARSLTKSPTPAGTGPAQP